MILKFYHLGQFDDGKNLKMIPVNVALMLALHISDYSVL